MLDPQHIRAHLDDVIANCRNRNVTADPAAVVRLDDERKRLVQEAQLVQQRANEIAKSIPKADPAKKQELIAEGKKLRDQVAAAEQQVKQVEADLHAVLLTIPNLSHPDAPVGKDPADNKVIHTWGDKPKFTFPIQDHIALVEKLDLADFEAGASVAGQKFYFLKNEAVLLELALVQYAIQMLLREGYAPIITPDLARAEVLEGIGF